MVLSCHRCSKSSSGPSAFLLTCGSCKRAWHHRCHIPPVEDAELIQRIRSTNAGDHDKGLAGWRCKRCKVKKEAETGSKTTTQSLRLDDIDNQQVSSFQPQNRGLALLKDQQVEVHHTDVNGPSSSIDATTQIFHSIKLTEVDDHHVSRYQQQQSSHTENQMGNLDTDPPPTTVIKRFPTKRALQEQRRDCLEGYNEHGHNLQLNLELPPASTKYARATDGKKITSSGHWSSSSVVQLKSANSVTPAHMEKSKAGKEDTSCVASCSATSLVSERATHSSSTSQPDQEEDDVHCDSVVKSSGKGNRQEVRPHPDTPSVPPVENVDIHMKSLDDSDDLHGTPVSRFGSSTLCLFSSTKQQGGFVTQERLQMSQGQELSEVMNRDRAGGVSHSHGEPEGQSSLTKSVPKDEPSLGPSWLKARHPVTNDPWRYASDRLHMNDIRRRKKPRTKALGNVSHSTATLDRELLKFFFFRDWIHRTEVEGSHGAT